MLNRWWADRQRERYWMEITNRADLGQDLHAPQHDEAGREYWSYSLVTEVRDGDVVFHYWKPEEAIVARSRVAGSAYEDSVIWGAQGSSARDAGVEPYRRPGWWVGLEDFEYLDPPLTLATVRERQSEVLAVRDRLGRESTPLYFPFVPYRGQALRTFQGYLTKFPADLIDLFPTLANATAIPRRASGRRRVGTTYRRAVPGTITQTTDPWSRDPSLVDRALRAHAETQNALADWLRGRGVDPRSPTPDEPNFDAAWESDGRLYVAEVKSLTSANEEKQLRLAVGQVLRYQSQLGGAPSVEAVIVLERRPTDQTWLHLLQDLGITVVWPGSWPRLQH